MIKKFNMLQKKSPTNFNVNNNGMPNNNSAANTNIGAPVDSSNASPSRRVPLKAMHVRKEKPTELY